MEETYFSNIDSEDKAYTLGLFASKSNQSNDMFVNKKLLQIAMCSQNMRTDLTRCLDDDKLPELKDDLKWVFIRGLLDQDGKIKKFKKGRKCSIFIESNGMKNSIKEFCNIVCEISDTKIQFIGSNAVDFLSKLYDNSNEKLRSSHNYARYIEYLGYSKIPQCKYIKTTSTAVAPSKNNASDEGYDLWIISIDKVISENTVRYNTHIKIRPEDGYHIEILPRSSLSNSGYILSNCTGLIDESYRGELKVPLTKIDTSLPDLQLPFKAVQMVLRKNMHFKCEESKEFEQTQRGSGGFGSTDSK